MSALTELQPLERDIRVLKNVLKGCSHPDDIELSSVAATRIYMAIMTSPIPDNFVPGSGNNSNVATIIQNADSAPSQQPPSSASNQYHTSVPNTSNNAGTDNSCCVVC
jgi:hypothetical protein